MTALSVWWRRNFGHRNDPPAMLPDPVTFTLRTQDPAHLLGKLNEDETHHGHGWTLADVLPDTDGWVRARFRREDGAYRWRDDSMQGF